MSPRHNRRDRAAYLPRGGEREIGATQRWGAGEWQVRTVSGQAATKVYRCPGCDQEIVPGTPHVVAWPVDTGGVGDRRHWHTPCWDARERRSAKPPRGWR